MGLRLCARGLRHLKGKCRHNLRDYNGSRSKTAVSLHVKSLLSFGMSANAASQPEDWNLLVGAELVFFLCAEYGYVGHRVLRIWDLAY
jgi:hypothetical protein